MELPGGSLAKVTPKGYLLILTLDFTIYGRDSLWGKQPAGGNLHGGAMAVRPNSSLELVN